VSNGSCFENFAPGGMRIDESQRRRALESMKLDFTRTHLNHFMSEKLDIYFASDFWEQATKNGYRVEIINVGYPKPD
jgi:phage terminase large subunit-like protein